MFVLLTLRPRTSQTLRNNKDKVSLTINKKLFDDRNSKANIKKEAQRTRSIKSEVVRLVCDNSKFLKYTQWKPKIKIEKGLDRTINWFREFKDLFKHDIYHV